MLHQIQLGVPIDGDHPSELRWYHVVEKMAGPILHSAQS